MFANCMHGRVLLMRGGGGGGGGGEEGEEVGKGVGGVYASLKTRGRL